MANNTAPFLQNSTDTSLSQFFTTLIPSAVAATIQMTIFIVIRTTFPRIYQPKSYLGPENRRVTPLPKTLFGWLPAILKRPKEDLIRTSSLDAYFFARYIHVHAIFFLFFFVLLAIILFPIYIVDGKGDAYGKTGLDILTFGNISPSHSSRYAAPLVLALVFIFAFIFMLYRELKIFVEKRQALLKSRAYQETGSARTILITSIPMVYMSQDVLLRIFNQFPGGVKYIWLNRNMKKLADLVKKRRKFVEKLETVHCKYVKKALKKKLGEIERPIIRVGRIPLLSSLYFGEKFDAISYYEDMISKLNDEIEEEKTKADEQTVLNSAFIQFHQPIAAHMAVQCAIASIPFAMKPCYLNVKPSNIIWSNLIMNDRIKRLRRLISLIIRIAMTIFWSIPVSFIGFLSNLTYLTNKLTFLRFIYHLPPVLLGLISGLLPSVLLALLMGLVPTILRLLAKFSGIATKDGIERYVQMGFFIFQVVQVFLVVTLSSSVASVATQIIQRPTMAAILLAANVPTASNFFLSFFSLRGLTLSSSLFLQITTLLSFYLFGKLFDKTPRKKWKRYFTFDKLGWGTIYPIFTSYIVITLVYSIIAPLILLISGLAFILCYIAFIYRIFYVSDFECDIGGLSFPRAIYQSFTGLYLMEIMLAGLFFTAQNENHHQSAIPEAIIMCVVILITLIANIVLHSRFKNLVHYLHVDFEEDSKLQTFVSEHVIEAYEDARKSAYMHPALRTPRPIVWIPNDDLGIANNEIQRIQSSELNISISTEGAQFNEKNNIEVNSSPPDYVEWTDKDIVLTRL